MPLIVFLMKIAVRRMYTKDKANQTDVQVFAHSAKPLLDGVLDGFNATVFAYGATGCGKTHTIR